MRRPSDQQSTWPAISLPNVITPSSPIAEYFLVLTLGGARYSLSFWMLGRCGWQWRFGVG